MPRMSKSKKLEWSFFLNDRGRKAYNTLCRRCVHDCKQSFRAVVVICPHYSNIGINKIDSMLRTPNCPFVLFVGTKKLVKRKEFEQFISEKLVI